MKHKHKHPSRHRRPRGRRRPPFRWTGNERPTSARPNAGHLSQNSSERVKLMFNYKSEYTITGGRDTKRTAARRNIPLLVVFASIICLKCLSGWPMSSSSSSSTALLQTATGAPSEAGPPPPPPPPLIGSDEYEEGDEGPGELAPSAATGGAGPSETARDAANQSTGGRPEEPTSDFFYLNSLFSHIDKQWKFAEMILIIVISAILNLVTIIGNIMVLISFKMDRSLQTVSNYFLLSLALADLLIGLISMPLYTLYLLLNYWPLGPLMCDLWLAIDYLNSNAAVLNMLIISFDRYFSVTRPLTYRAKRTTKHAILMISGAWIFSLTIWTPAIFTYPYFKGRTVQGTDKCEIEFVKANTYLTFVTAILAFYIPVIIMIYLYWRIWLETKKRYRDLTTLFLVSGVGAAAHTRPHHRATPAAVASNTGGCLTAPIGAAGNGAIRRTGSTRSQHQREAPGKAVQNNSQQRRPAEEVGAPAASKGKCPTGPQGAPKGGSLTSRAVGEPCKGEPSTQVESIGQKSESAKQTRPPPTASCKCPGCPKSSSVQRLTPAGAAPATKCPYCPAVDIHYESSLANCKLCKEQQQTNAAAQATPKCKPASSRHGAHHRHSHGHHHGHHNHHQHHHHGHPSHQNLHSKRSQSSGGGGCCPSTNKKSLPPCCSCCCPSCCNSSNSRRHSSRRDRHQEQQQQQQQQQQLELLEKNPAKSRPSSFWFGSGGSSSQINNINHSSTNSLVSCAQSAAQSTARHHKIHPQQLSSSSLSTCPAGDETKVKLNNEPEPGQPAERRQNEPECNQTDRAQKKLVDVATSPIDSSCLSLWPLFISNSNSQLEQDEQEDCETRIVSLGDKLKFETNDPKLGRNACPLRGANVAACPAPLAGCSWMGPHRSKSACKLLANQQQQQQTCCCAEVMTAHDAECRLCRPTTRPEQHPLSQQQQQHHHHHHHNGHHHHHHHHHHDNSHHSHRHQAACKQCKQVEQNAKQEPLATGQEGARDESTSLPILCALQQQHPTKDASELQQTTGQAAPGKHQPPLQSPPPPPAGGKDNKRAKKFSQKLTFSDILVEQANCRRELTREQEQSELRRSNELRMKYADESDFRQPSPGPADGHEFRFNWFRRLLEPIKAGAGGLARPKSILRDSRRHQDEENLSISSSETNKVSNRKLLNAISGSKSLVSLPIKGISSKLSGSMPLIMNQQVGRYNGSNNRRTGGHRNSSEDSDRPPTNQRRLSATNGNGNSNSNGNGNGNGSGNGNHQHSGKASYSSHHPIQPKSERKAAKTLSTLLLVFIVTWLPYNILVLIKTLSGGEDQVPEKIWNFSYYLCYINSTINPLCYALCNAQFRRTYMRILKCKLSNDQHNSTRRLLVPLQSSTTWNKDLRLNSDAAGLGALASPGASADGNGHGHPQHQHYRGGQSQASGSSGHSSSFNGRPGAH